MALTRPTAAQIVTTTADFSDPLIVLNKDQASTNTKDIGFIFERGSDTNVGIIWDESTNNFALINTTETGNTEGNVSISSYANITVSSITASGLSYPTSDGTSGQVIVTDGSGNLTFVDQSGGGGGGSYTASSTAPLAPTPGDEWWDTDDGSFYKYIDDGTNEQWVEWGPNNSLDGSELITGNLIPDVDNTYDIGSATKTLSTVYATATSAQYADLAEIYTADQQYPVGTVLQIGGSAEVTLAQADSHSVVGTVSDKPAYLMNSGLTGKRVVSVAYIGRVPCRVIGEIHRGDLLKVSSVPGVAERVDTWNLLPGQLLGKALESYNSTFEGTIEITVGRL